MLVSLLLSHFSIASLASSSFSLSSSLSDSDTSGLIINSHQTFFKLLLSSQILESFQINHNDIEKSYKARKEEFSKKHDLSKLQMSMHSLRFNTKSLLGNGIKATLKQLKKEKNLQESWYTPCERFSDTFGNITKTLWDKHGIDSSFANGIVVDNWYDMQYLIKNGKLPLDPSKKVKDIASPSSNKTIKSKKKIQEENPKKLIVEPGFEGQKTIFKIFKKFVDIIKKPKNLDNDKVYDITNYLSIFSEHFIACYTDIIGSFLDENEQLASINRFKLLISEIITLFPIFERRILVDNRERKFTFTLRDNQKELILNLGHLILEILDKFDLHSLIKAFGVSPFTNLALFNDSISLGIYLLNVMNKREEVDVDVDQDEDEDGIFLMKFDHDDLVTILESSIDNEKEFEKAKDEYLNACLAICFIRQSIMIDYDSN